MAAAAFLNNDKKAGNKGEMGNREKRWLGEEERVRRECAVNQILTHLCGFTVAEGKKILEMAQKRIEEYAPIQNSNHQNSRLKESEKSNLLNEDEIDEFIEKFINGYREN